MSQESRSTPALFTQVDITAGVQINRGRDDGQEEQVGLLRSILAAQDRQNELLEEMVSQLSSAHAPASGGIGPMEAGQSRTGTPLSFGGQGAQPGAGRVPRPA